VDSGVSLTRGQFAYLGGRYSEMVEFEEYCESSICVSGVEMEVRREPTLEEVMAIPAYRRENSVIEIKDRFDRALNVFIKMNEKLDKIVDKLDYSNEKLDKIIENTDILPEILEISKSTKADITKIVENTSE